MEDRWFGLGDRGRYHALQTKMKRKNFSIRWLFAITVFISIPLALYSWVRVYESPRNYFRRVAGTELPRSSQLIRDRSTYAPYSSDGDRCLMFTVDKQELDAFIRQKPPWSDLWRTGQIPREYDMVGFDDNEYDVHYTFDTINLSPKYGDDYISNGAVVAIDVESSIIRLHCWFY